MDKKSLPAVKATFPRSDTELVVLFTKAFKTGSVSAGNFSCSSLRVREVHFDESQPRSLVLRTSNMRADEIVIDQLQFKGLSFADTGRPISGKGPKFVLGVKDPSGLRGPHVENIFPYASTLIGLHVTVACCTGCNGGVHDRNLVVLNHHLGGPGTGIWIQTGKTIDAPYPRWQKVLCAGGVVSEQSGSTTVVDRGWMQIVKQFETPHHAPSALPIETVDLPNSRSKAFFHKSLDASWVQFDDIRVESAQSIEPAKGKAEIVRLARNEITFTDRSGGRTTAYLYQSSGLAVREGQPLSMLRGFVHAEKPGLYVLLSDKDEDIRF
jgi:hypothetical protein